MTEHPSQPTEDDVRAFVRKFDVFRDSLSEPERALLDALASAAVAAHDDEVTGFAALVEYGLLVGLIAVICVGDQAPATKPGVTAVAPKVGGASRL
jgi:hypothetical protein